MAANLEALLGELPAELKEDAGSEESDNGEDGSEEEEEEVTVEHILADVLLQCYDDPDEQKSIISYSKQD